MKFKPLLGIIIYFRTEATSCVLKAHENIHAGFVQVMASVNPADCIYCTIFVHWVDLTIPI